MSRIGKFAVPLIVAGAVLAVAGITVANGLTMQRNLDINSGRAALRHQSHNLMTTDGIKIVSRFNGTNIDHRRDLLGASLGFEGVWNVESRRNIPRHTWFKQDFHMVFKQDANGQMIGFYRSRSGYRTDGDIQGTVQGRTLSFVWSERLLHRNGSGSLVLDSGGETFSGSWRANYPSQDSGTWTGVYSGPN